MAARAILALACALFPLALTAGPAAGAVAADLQCTGELAGVVARNVTVPAGGSCVLRNSTVTGHVSAPTASYFQALHTGIGGDVVGTGAQTVFLDRGSSVRGSVRVSGVAQVFVFHARIRKSVKIDRTTDQVYVCGSTVERGHVKVTHSARDIVIGDPGTGGCAGNLVRRGNMSVLWNSTDVQLVVSGNRFPKGNLLVAANTGPSRKVVRRNSGGGHIACQANAGRFRASGNRRWKSGACGLS